MKNVPRVRMGIVAVSRDCFPVELSKRRRVEVVKAAQARKTPLVEIKTVVEKEADVLEALAEIQGKDVNALVVFLGNFGPEGPSTLLAQRFNGPVMFVAAAEETGKDLFSGRGDAFCGLLSASYNLGLRRLNCYLPDFPVGTAEEVAEMIADFEPVARVLLGLKKLKIFVFGPRPQDFLTCHAPLQPLYDLGVEIMENSELDLYDVFLQARGDRRIRPVSREMARELGPGLAYPDLLDKLAQYEVALMKFFEANRGVSTYGVFANKCWPAFEKYFGFVPCYVNSRLAQRGIPVACEADIYGALSEYLIACATKLPVTLLDINNTVPADMVKAAKGKLGGYRPSDLFMGFHCGNTPSACLVDSALKYQLIMHRLMEPEKEPDITRGTMEGRIRPGKVTIFRLQSTPEARLRAYVAEGEVLDITPQSFGSIGIFAIKEMARFYRHVLLEKRFPHHTAVAFDHSGKALYSAVRLLGVEEIFFNQPVSLPYPGENPFGR